MAKRMPKSKTKSNINYSKIAKELKGKVSFPVDLRKTDKNPSIKTGETSFNFGERMALLKAFKEYREFKNTTTLIPIRKEKGESKKAYKQRLSETKKEYGQAKTHFPGVWSDTKSFSKTKTKRVQKSNGKWTTEISSITKGRRVELEVGYGQLNIKELFVPVDPLQFAKNPKAFMREMKKKYKNADYIQPVHSGHRTSGAGLDNESFKRFIDKLTKWSNAYSQIDKKQNQWLTGFLIIKYDIKPEKGAFGKPLSKEKGKAKKANRKGR